MGRGGKRPDLGPDAGQGPRRISTMSRSISLHRLKLFLRLSLLVPAPFRLQWLPRGGTSRCTAVAASGSAAPMGDRWQALHLPLVTCADDALIL